MASSSLIVGIVGDPGVGKRNLALSFKTKQPTAANAELDFTQLEADGMTLVMISSADAAGKFAIQRADILLVVFALDSPHSFLSCEKKWAAELKSEKKPIILVGTKSDKKLLTRQASSRSPQSSIDGPRLQKDLKALSFVSCSATTREGIEGLFNETMAAGLKVKKHPKQVSGKGGVFGGLFRKTNALYPDNREGVEINNDTDAAELKNVCFPLKLIKEKWLFHTDEYLKPQKDRGPSSALHGALCCLKNLYYMEGKQWAMKRDSVPIHVGLIKATSDCGNSSVSMGLAWIYFKKATKDDKALALINCGTGGVRFQLYVKTAGTVSCLLEFKPPGGGKGVFTNLRCGSYVPKQEQPAVLIAEEIKQGLANAPWNNPKLREKMAKQFGLKSAEQLKVPVVAYITGTIRNHWESKLGDPKETEIIEKAVNGVLEYVLPGRDSYFTTILGEEKPGYLIKQRTEGQMELTGLRGLYSQYSAATGAALVGPGPPQAAKDNPFAGRNLEPVISLGIGKGSSQWTTVDAANADDYTKYTLEPEIKYGMDADDLGERLASAIINEYKVKGTDSLANLMESVFKRGHIPVIALKSGCLLNLDDAAKSKEGGPSGRERRKILVELGAVASNMFPRAVIFARKSGERTQEMLGTSSVAVACAQACKTLMLPGEDPIPQFLKVQVEGQEGFLTSDQLKDIKPKTVLVFLTAADLAGKTVAGPAKHMPRSSQVELKPKRTEKIIMEGLLKRKDANGRGWTEKYFVLTRTDFGWMDRPQERMDNPAPASFVSTGNILSCSAIPDDSKCRFELEVSYGEGEEAAISLDAPDAKACLKWQRRIGRLLQKLLGESVAADRSTDDEAPTFAAEKKNPPPPPPRAAPTRAAPKKEDDPKPVKSSAELAPAQAPASAEKPKPTNVPLPAKSGTEAQSQASAFNLMMGDLGLEEEDEEEPPEDDDDTLPAEEDSEEDVPTPVPNNPSTKGESSSELSKALTSLGLSEYLPVLNAEEYLLSDLPCLSEAELLQLIPSAGARAKLVAYLRDKGLSAKPREKLQPWTGNDETKAAFHRLQKKLALQVAEFQTQAANFSNLHLS